ncbi:MAG: hypothetical protein VKK59_03485 [Vampirovibrionales bacterium]|nr:hypothetical protein [Vampirovibrionales bacterium]
MSPYHRINPLFKRLISSPFIIVAAVAMMSTAYGDVSQVDFSDLPSGSGVRVTFHASQTVPHKLLKTDAHQIILEIDDPSPATTLKTRFKKTDRVKNVMIERSGHHIRLSLHGQELGQPLVGFSLPVLKQPMGNPQQIFLSESERYSPPVKAPEQITPESTTPKPMTPKPTKPKPTKIVEAETIQTLVKPSAASIQTISKAPQVPAESHPARSVPAPTSPEARSPEPGFSDLASSETGSSELYQEPTVTRQPSALNNLASADVDMTSSPETLRWSDLLSLKGFRKAFQSAHQQKHLMPILLMTLGCLVGIGCLVGLIALKLIKKSINPSARRHQAPESSVKTTEKLGFSEALAAKKLAQKTPTSGRSSGQRDLLSLEAPIENRSLLSKAKSNSPQGTSGIKNALASYHQQANMPVSLAKNTPLRSRQEPLKPSSSPVAARQGKNSDFNALLPRVASKTATRGVSAVKSPISSATKNAPALNTDVQAFLQSMAQQLEGRGDHTVARVLQNQLSQRGNLDPR